MSSYDHDVWLACIANWGIIGAPKPSCSALSTNRVAASLLTRLSISTTFPNAIFSSRVGFSLLHTTQNGSNWFAARVTDTV